MVNRKSGGTLLVECLKNLGAKKCFGVPGESYLDVLDALYDTKEKLDFILCRNEGGASFMAEAWGKLTGEPGICMVTRGPGATNASIGVHTAMQNSTPMILFVGQVGLSMKGREAFQEIDYTSFYGTVAKWVVEIDDANRIPEILARAWSIAQSGRKGPVVIALPEDMLTSSTNVSPCGPIKLSEPAPRQTAIEEIKQILSHASRPLIIAGGSGWNNAGKTSLQNFSENNKIPVLAAFRFQDIFDNCSPCYAGDAGVGMLPHVKELITNADVIIAINIRFGEMTTDGYSLFDVPHPKQKLIHTHISDREIGKIYIADVPVHAGPNQTCHALEDLSLNLPTNWQKNARKSYLDSFDLPRQPGPVDMVEVARHISSQLPDDAIITNGAGNFATWPNKFIKYTKQMRLLAPQNGAMGYGIPAAIAAKIARPKTHVLCFAGDGDFQMNCQELASAKQANAFPIILILNNGTYGTIRMHQERHYPARVSGTDIENPNFVALAKSYGFHSEKISATKDFPDAFKRALDSNCGAVLELEVSSEALTPRQTLSQIRETASNL